jgi:hypothetical protein
MLRDPQTAFGLIGPGLICVVVLYVAFLCRVAWTYEQPVVAAVLTALACGVVMIAAALRHV